MIKHETGRPTSILCGTPLYVSTEPNYALDLPLQARRGRALTVTGPSPLVSTRGFIGKSRRLGVVC